MRGALIACSTLVCLAVCACGGVDTDCQNIICFSDTEGDYGLDSAYVVGAQIELVLDGPVGEVNSSDAGIIQISGRESRGTTTRVFCRAIGPGSAALIIEDKQGKVRTRANVRVEVPTRVELRPLVAQTFGMDPPLVLEPRTALVVLSGGAARYSLHYFKGTEALAGKPEVEVDVISADLGATVIDSGGMQVLELEAGRVGPGGLGLRTGGWLLQAVVVEIVDADGLRSLWIHEPRIDQQVQGGRALLWLRALDDHGREVFGLNASWEVEEEPAIQYGDPLFSYTVSQTCSASVTARVAHREASALVGMQGGDCRYPLGLGCGSQGDRVDLLWLVFALAGWIARRRAQIRSRLAAGRSGTEGPAG